MSGPQPLPPREAYALWAGTYEAENALTTLDELAASWMTPHLADASLLDAACGTGRRLTFEVGNRPVRAVGVDLVFEMLAAGRGRDGRRVAAAEIPRLPFAGAAFDVVWCRLAAGHIESLGAFYAELARVTRPRGEILVTDFHPAAARAGHTRTFRDGGGAMRTVAHVVHPPEAHEEAAARAGLRFDARLSIAIGGEVERFYRDAGALDRFARDRGLPLLLALRFLR